MTAANLSMDDASRSLWDVVVVGAGPAGAVASRQLASLGVATLLIDRSTFPRPKVCGCCLNEAAIHTLEHIGLTHRQLRLDAIPLRRFQWSAGGATVRLRLPGGFAVSRSSLDAALVDDAVSAGATFISGAEVVGVAAADAWTLRVRHRADRGRPGTIRGRILIAADGLNGRVRAALSPSSTMLRSRIGAGTIMDVQDDAFEPGTIYMAVGAGGYVGAVRLEDGRLNIAAAFDAPFVRSAGSLATAASFILDGSGVAPIPELESARWRGTPELSRIPRRVAGERWFSVGDAAGYVEPFTGEGMAWAIASGAAVAPIALQAVDRWWSKLAAEWSAVHARIVGSRRPLCRIVSVLLRSPKLTQAAVRALALAPILAAPVVKSLNRPFR